MGIIKALLSSAAGKILSIIWRLWSRHQAKQEGKDEARAEQTEQQLRDARKAQRMEQEVGRADGDDLDRWLRHPDERE